MTDTIRNLLQRAIDTHGVQIQIFKAVEEMGELLTAIGRFEASGEDWKAPEGPKMLDNIAEEVADVRIMLNAPALLHEVQAPAAPGWHPEDAPGLVAPAEGSGATAKDQICMIFDVEDRAVRWRWHKLQRLKERLDQRERLSLQAQPEGQDAGETRGCAKHNGAGRKERLDQMEADP